MSCVASTPAQYEEGGKKAKYRNGRWLVNVKLVHDNPSKVVIEDVEQCPALKKRSSGDLRRVAIREDELSPTPELSTLALENELTENLGVVASQKIELCSSSNSEHKSHLQDCIQRNSSLQDELSSISIIKDNRKRLASPQNEHSAPDSPQCKKRKRGGIKKRERFNRWLAGLAADDPIRGKIEEKKQERKIREEKYRMRKEIKAKREDSDEKLRLITEYEVVHVKGDSDNVNNSFLKRMAIESDLQSPSPTPAIINRSENDLSLVAVEQYGQNSSTAPVIINQSENDLSRVAIQQNERTPTLKNLEADQRNRSVSSQNDQITQHTPVLKKNNRRGGIKKRERFNRWLASLAADDPRRVKIEEKKQEMKIRQEKYIMRQDIEDRAKWIMESKMKQERKIREEKYRIRQEIEDKAKWIMESEVLVNVEGRGELDYVLSNSFLNIIGVQHDEQYPTVNNLSPDDQGVEAMQENGQNPTMNQSAGDPRRVEIQENHVPTPATMNQSADDPRRVEIQQEGEELEVNGTSKL